MQKRSRRRDAFAPLRALLAVALVAAACTVANEGLDAGGAGPMTPDAAFQGGTGGTPAGGSGGVGVGGSAGATAGAPGGGAGGSGGADTGGVGGALEGGSGGSSGLAGAGGGTTGGGAGGGAGAGGMLGSGGAIGTGGSGTGGTGAGGTGTGGSGAGGSGPAVKGPNLVDNPGFEQGLVDWTSARGSGGIVTPGHESFSGLSEPDPLGWWQQNVGGFVRGRDYLISGWARSPMGGCRIGVKGGVGAGELRRDSEPFGTEWEQRSFVLTIPEDLRWFQIFLANTGSTDCEYDDLSILQLDSF